jgi:hypothetical protein
MRGNQRSHERLIARFFAARYRGQVLDQDSDLEDFVPDQFSRDPNPSLKRSLGPHDLSAASVPARRRRAGKSKAG